MFVLGSVVFLSLIVSSDQTSNEIRSRENSWRNIHLDCSTNNPCGLYGYCRMKSGEIVCECKFWWGGARCDQQTESGKQVIALGCLLGVLIIIFYGLDWRVRIARKLRARKEKPKEPKIKK